MDLAGAIQDYQSRPEAGPAQHQTMVRFLESCRELLEPLQLYFSTSHSTLVLSKYQEYRQRVEHPSVTIWADGTMLELTYHENWEDGPCFRVREDRVRCELEYARAALAEFLNRLKVRRVDLDRAGG